MSPSQAISLEDQRDQIDKLDYPDDCIGECILQRASPDSIYFTVYLNDAMKEIVVAVLSEKGIQGLNVRRHLGHH